MTFKGDVKLLQIVTKEFIERFNALNNIIADVYIKHILYGSQKIKECVLHPFMGEDRIGLIINGEDIYVTMKELSCVDIDNTKCIIRSEVMELCIKFL